MRRSKENPLLCASRQTPDLGCKSHGRLRSRAPEGRADAHGALGKSKTKEKRVAGLRSGSFGCEFGGSDFVFEGVGGEAIEAAVGGFGLRVHQEAHRLAG